MPTWAIILIVFMMLLSIEAIFKGFYRMRSFKTLAEYSTELEKRQAVSIELGLLNADELFHELKASGEFTAGETFIFSDCVSASIAVKADGMYFDIYVEKTKVSRVDYETETIPVRELKSSRFLKRK